MSKDIKMPTQEGKSAGEFWYGLLVNPAIASHIWSGRVWQPLLTDEDILNAKVNALRAQNAELLELLREFECDCEETCESEFDKMEWCGCYKARAAIRALIPQEPA